MIGRTLGSYRIVEQIGIGGMATVYKAYDPNTDRYVAIKVLPHYFSQDPTFRERFQREAKAIARLEHLHILPIFAYGEEEGTAYMAMRYLDAGTLTDLIEQGPLPLEKASRILNQIAGALDHAHTHGVLHRDIKPGNVLLDADGNAFLTDFGIAKMIEVTLDLTAGGILGTPAYMSPEQCRGKVELTPATDQYALGIVLYEMITGRTPFQAETPIALIHKQLNEPLPPPQQLLPTLPDQAQQVILKALAKEPEQRHQSCGAMAAAFAQAVAQMPPDHRAAALDDTLISAKPAHPTAPPVMPPATSSAPPPAQPIFRRIPAWSLWVVGALAIILIISAVAWLLWRPPAPDTVQITAPPGNTTPAESENVIELERPGATARRVDACVWNNHGPGLCIYPIWGGNPRKLLADTDFDFTQGGLPGWSPDGRRLAFAAIEPDQPDNRIFVINADGSGLVDLPGHFNDVAPAWSPDGERLVFHSGGSLATMRPDGSDYIVLVPANGQDICTVDPQWSPDSQWIVASMLKGGCDWELPGLREIWLVNRSGEKVIRLNQTRHDDEECQQFQTAFSPDGQRVAAIDGDCRPFLVDVDNGDRLMPINEFPVWWTSAVYPQWNRARISEEQDVPESVSEEPAPEENGAEKMGREIIEVCQNAKPPQLCLRNSADSRITQITEALDFGHINRPVWAPDGNQIIFAAGSSPAATDHTLYRIEVNGENLRAVTRGNSNDMMPAWSPDGEQIAFHRNCGLWLVHPVYGQDKMLIREGEMFCAIGPAWAPDSQRIAFYNITDEGHPPKIEVINANGRDRQTLFTFKRMVDTLDLAWSPDGKEIAGWYIINGKPELVLLDVEGNNPPQIIKEEPRMPWHWRAEFRP